MSADFAAQVKLAESRDRSAISLKKEMRDNIIPVVVALGMKIQEIAGSNLPMLVRSGAPLRKAPESVILELPKIFNVTLGASGELIVKTNSIYGALFYTAKFTPNPLGDKVIWQSVTQGVSRFVLSGVEPGIRYWVQMEIKGSKNQVVTTQMVLSPLVQ